MRLHGRNGKPRAGLPASFKRVPDMRLRIHPVIAPSSFAAGSGTSAAPLGCRVTRSWRKRRQRRVACARRLPASSNLRFLQRRAEPNHHHSGTRTASSTHSRNRQPHIRHQNARAYKSLSGPFSFYCRAFAKTNDVSFSVMFWTQPDQHGLLWFGVAAGCSASERDPARKPWRVVALRWPLPRS